MHRNLEQQPSIAPYTAPMNATLHPPPDRRLALVLTALLHALLLLGWQATRRAPAPVQTEPSHIQWIDLRPRTQALPRPAPERTPEHEHEHTPERAHANAPAREAIQVAPATALPAPVAPGPLTAPSAPDAQAISDPGAAAVTAAPSAQGGPLLQGALRAAGSVDKALRKENNAYIVKPPDSPMIRMRKGMEVAHEMAPPKPWEAPRIEELANSTGNGERHTRVRGAFGTYCIGNRSVGSSMALNQPESGSQLHTSTCLSGEEPAAEQEWKTARD
jgi:hypothetical protein